uniref:Ubiquitin-like protease family profile domain-containing protein n=1 Tax=Cucumis melo TaxID=3656 RepID=A0A9I9E7Y8_CUCME
MNDVLKERDLIKMPTEKEVVCESISTFPLALKSILRYAEKVMEKDSSITFSLPADLFGISRKSSMLREDIIDLCNMNEVKTFTLVAYMMYLYSSVLGSKENVQGHWTLLAINVYKDTVFYLDSLRTTSKATTRYCPLQVGSTGCGYYVMKYMREIVNRGSIVISDSLNSWTNGSIIQEQ